MVVASSTDEAVEAIDLIMRQRAFGDAGRRILVEETLRGQEVSYHVVADGTSYVRMAPAQDHKRIFDGDRGPNTGGMGAYSPPPVVTAEVERKILERIVEPTLRGMAAEGHPFRGALFVGLLSVLVVFFVSTDQGAVSVFAGTAIHEWVHDGRHLLGYPCH